jgi:hypothetical protein
LLADLEKWENNKEIFIQTSFEALPEEEKESFDK